ncbi:helix-turn-helix domain-containing protein [Ideonella sp. 4Y11]|uniref:Helix-turn-helix domain-containing protein n=1 Tax=Ideonella aquatica TaxID=2824119 RepID=A0A940YDJ7_9BURK|nr:AraC family transcriptional regulator [Ideonella aquatica]MBQ0958203.1 helix-turn-helix domain-containing protein [Ideonella aquatica]
MKIAREIIRHPEASMRCMRLRLPAFRGSLHRHGHCELTWIERGRGLRWVGDRVEPFGDGDLVLLGAELPHVWLSAGPAAQGRHEATVLQFPQDWCAQAAWPELAGLAGVLARAARGLAVEGATRAQVQPLLARMPSADAPRRVALLIELLAVLAEAPAHALRPLSRHAPVAGSDAVHAARRDRLTRLLDWIQRHLGDELRVADAAAIVGISPAAFGRFFRRELGCGFTEFVNDARCSWAAQRLLECDEPVAAIALDCGFPTLSHFGQQFRRRHGCSPRDYRRHGPLAQRPPSPIRGPR